MISLCKTTKEDGSVFSFSWILELLQVCCYKRFAAKWLEGECWCMFLSLLFMFYQILCLTNREVVSVFSISWFLDLPTTSWLLRRLASKWHLWRESGDVCSWVFSSFSTKLQVIYWKASVQSVLSKKFVYKRKANTLFMSSLSRSSQRSTHQSWLLDPCIAVWVTQSCKISSAGWSCSLIVLF